jgi:hypothetical protein
MKQKNPEVTSLFNQNAFINVTNFASDFNFLNLNYKEGKTLQLNISHLNKAKIFCSVFLAWLRFSLHNGSFTVMSIQPNGRVSISILGEAGSNRFLSFV